MTEEKLKAMQKINAIRNKHDNAVDKYLILKQLRINHISEILKNIIAQFNLARQYKIVYGFKTEDFFTPASEELLYENFLNLCEEITMREFMEMFPVDDWYKASEQLYNYEIVGFLERYSHKDVKLFYNFYTNYLARRELAKY